MARDVVAEIDFLRIQAGMSKTELAKRLGVTKAYVSQLFSGKENLTLKTLAKLSLVFGRKWMFDQVGGCTREIGS